MKKILLLSGLLILGLIVSQLYPGLVGDSYETWRFTIQSLTLVCLSFIMIHVGYEFDLDKSNMGQYGWDYVVAMTAAAFPWIMCALYFMLILPQMGGIGNVDEWKNSLLLSRFAAPTSAGVLFTMLAAAGLATTWVFKKARILAIFDDIDTVLLMIPLKMLMVGLKWQLGIIVLVMVAMLWLAWRFLHVCRIPLSWPWVLTYSVLIVAACSGVYEGSKVIDSSVPIHLEVLLPAFVLGCMIARPKGADGHDVLHEPSKAEVTANLVISSAFMVLVGLMMPPLQQALGSTGASLASLPWGTIGLHVLAITVLSNLGKMFPAFCYRREAHWKARLGVAIGMWPRGEVGAGVLVISLSYGISGQPLIVAMLSLALNLMLTGVFIAIVKKLLSDPKALEVPARVAA